MPPLHTHLSVFFFNAPATTEIYTLSLHDALPISTSHTVLSQPSPSGSIGPPSSSGNRSRISRCASAESTTDRKSTRLNSSHPSISYAVFCLKKKKKKQTDSYNHFRLLSAHRNEDH